MKKMWQIAGCFDENHQYVGPVVTDDASYVYANDSGECQSLCAANSESVFFAFHEESEQCFLMGAGAIERRIYKAGWTSGPCACPNVTDGKVKRSKLLSRSSWTNLLLVELTIRGVNA